MAVDSDLLGAKMERTDVRGDKVHREGQEEGEGTLRTSASEARGAYA
jgi:hypothetical protein